MYTVYADDILLYSPNAATLGYTLSSAKVTYEINKAGSFDYAINPGNPSYSAPQRMKSAITIFDGETEIWRGRILDDETDFYKTKQVVCEGELAYLNDVAIGPYHYDKDGIAMNEFFRRLIQVYTNHCDKNRMIRPGNVTAIDPEVTIYVKSDDYSDIMTELTNFLNEFGGYVTPRRQNGICYLDYSDDEEVISDQAIKFGENLLDLTSYIDASEVYTYIIPLGKKGEDGRRVNITSVNNGNDYLKSDVGEKLFGVIYRAAIWDDIEDPNQLKKNAEALLDSMITEATTLEVTALDLRLLGVDAERLQVGKNVRVQSVFHDIDENFLCSKIELDLLEPDQSVYTFGLERATLTGGKGYTSGGNSYRLSVDLGSGYEGLRDAVNELGDRVTKLEESGGGGNYKAGSNIIIGADGTISVDTTTAMEEDNTKPITSSGVYAVVGNIAALLHEL